MHSMRKQYTLAQQSLISGSKFDFGDGKSVPQMQRTIHIWVRKVAKPLGVLLPDLGRGQTVQLVGRWSIDLEETFFLPFLLVFLL